MQVMIHVDNATRPNPKFDRKKPQDRDTNWPEESVPKGTIIDHPDAYLLCRGADPRAIPHDDEAKAIHEKYLNRRAKAEAAAEANAAPDDVGDAAAPADPKVRRRQKAVSDEAAAE